MRALIALFFSLAAAQAASILTVNFAPNPQSGTPGQTLTFSGTLENNTGNVVFINSNSYTFDITGLGVLDDTVFFINAPLSLDPFITTAPFDFFTVVIPGGQATGAYLGVFTVLGGADDLASDILGSGSFQVDVTDPGVPGVPEPATFLLIGGGLGLLVWRRR